MYLWYNEHVPNNHTLSHFSIWKLLAVTTAEWPYFKSFCWHRNESQAKREQVLGGLHLAMVSYRFRSSCCLAMAFSGSGLCHCSRAAPSRTFHIIFAILLTRLLLVT